MTQEQIQNLFKQGYNQVNWKQFLGETFAKARLLANPETLIGIDTNVAKQALKLGHILLDENGIERQIAVYEVTLARGIILERNRVGLRNLLRKYWKDIDAAFIVYQNADSKKWRFTYVSELTGYDSEGEFVKIKTEPKRYTYVLGEGESTRTAAERFALIAKKVNQATLDDVKEAFSVEKLSKAFFDEYKKHYDIFCDFMVSKPNIRQTIFNGDEKGIRDFNKKLLGRIVFLYFIQKKGWLGVPVASKWGEGNFNFISDLFNNCKNPDLFYSELLSKLFFDTLNCKRPDDLIELVKGQPCRIPYLNGGLFEEDDKKHRNLIFNAQLFKNLFDFFNQYNFTIYEDDPNDHTVAVDPEMLGHIFENLLEDNKDKGAFYTPKEIVHYMCQESLIEYLCTSLQIEDEAKEKEAITNLLKKKEIDAILKPEIKNINNALDKVKICDPAIGSGAFPMGLLLEIYTAKQTLHTFEFGNTTKFDASAVKLNIIQNSIYGVDIEKGAVDIARLRFWLSLIVDEPEPKALPNLDYKIVVGNSLVSKLGDDVIDIDWEVKEGTQTDFFSNSNVLERKKLLEKISKEQKEFFNSESDKKKLAADIRNLKIDLLINQLDLMVKTTNQETVPKASSYKDKKKFVKATELYHQSLGWKESIKQLTKLKNKPEQPLHFFDWKLDFPEVMNEQINTNSGFDIVIGNPPYVFSRENLSNEDKKIYNDRFKLTQFKINLYILFIEKGFNLLTKNGTFFYITPNNWLTLDTNSDLREFILKETYSIKILQNYANVFESASVDTVIIGFKKQGNTTVDYLEWIEKLPTVLNQKNKNEYLTKAKFIITHSSENTTSSFMSKIIGTELKLIADVKNGVQAYTVGEGTPPCSEEMKDKRVYHSTTKKGDNWLKYLDGVDVGRYNIGWSGQFIKYGKNLSRPRQFNLFDGERILVRQIPNQLPYCINASFTDELTINDNNSMIVKPINPKFKVKYILAILNSKLISKWFAIYFGKLSRKIFPQFKINELRIFPIASVNTQVQSRFEKLVNQIHTGRSKGKNTSDIEIEIDNLVYKLYELTYDEVKVIDPEFCLTKKEYEAIQLE